MSEEQENRKKDMDTLLVELFDSQYGEAIRQYVRRVDSETIASLVVTDPFANPTQVARSQGIRIGIYHLESYVLGLKKSREEVPQDGGGEFPSYDA